MLRSVFHFLVFLLVMYAGTTMAQCPTNIGFEQGDFTGWEGDIGTIERNSGAITFTNHIIVNGLQSIITRASQQVDEFAGFKLASPNGSNAIAKLGDKTTGSKAQRLTYTFTVPANNNNFSLIYYYAVVLEDPTGGNHTNANKPKFTAAVFNVSDNKYTDCANFNFVSISNLPGFKFAPTQNSANQYNDIYYKDWSPVTIDLRGYAGKTLRLEFTTNNCGPGAHFAYAYIDINQNCTSPVTGNVICDINKPVTLVAPSGFLEYHWYKTKDPNIELSQSPTFSIFPPPEAGTQYSVRIVPYPNLGCEDIITTTIKNSNNLVFNVTPQLYACKTPGADITTPDITAGTDKDFTFAYYSDMACQDPVIDPKAITEARTYYIKAIADTSGCDYVKPIQVIFKQAPNLVIHNPHAVCKPNMVDVTADTITTGSTFYDKLEYYIDANATIAYQTPSQVSASGTYYIKAINSASGCYDIKPITVLVDELPILQTRTIYGCGTADITVDSVTRGSSFYGLPTYWKDAATSIPLDNPKAITASTTCYIKVANAADCFVTAPLTVKIFAYPQIQVTNPASVVFPTTVDITQAFTHNDTTSYFYYRDSLATKVLTKPETVTRAGTYYIKAINGNDCAVIERVKVDIAKPPDVNYSVNTFTPNADGKNDVFHIVIPAAIKLKHFRVYGSWGGLLFETSDAEKGWDGTSNGKKMAVGTYYWIFEGYDTYINQEVKKSGSISIVM
ncbi:T9SS C-terminal target domain-containing protein [Mucilaginibacter paludis]|uniref:Gliding motility-associated C-terminal domain-containing protein n=1 Tax=Mucilaginibacter paludis DSM 18603 TaxID=714943 RepID=H1Y7U3_9SPHI|nr:T9SS C-terminal target domain-containing protein [Mucilaginibacter paludis]EHQ30429.1 hypothetical protein Mucpa_6375 [Mucilaginibacter paludis DSM 18603]